MYIIHFSYKILNNFAVFFIMIMQERISTIFYVVECLLSHSMNMLVVFLTFKLSEV